MNQLGALERFYTSSYVTNEKLQQHFLKCGNSFWVRRFIDGLPGEKVSANWRFELKETILRKLQGKSAAVQRAVYERDEKFDRYVSKQLNRYSRRNETHKFWGFQGSCHRSLAVAKSLGIESWCELATAHVVAAKRILGEEALLHPEWKTSIDNLVFPPAYEKRLEEEPLLADKVVAASSFTQSTLLEIGIAPQNIIYLPLGCDIDHVPYSEYPDGDFSGRPLKLLYAGTVTQRKGIKYLLEAMKRLVPNPSANPDIELHIIGGIQGVDEPLKAYSGWYKYHAPVSQQALFKLYREFDALVLPTVFEGFGLVIVEAMAAGLPVITTPHSIGPELITNGENGYIVPIRDIDSLVKAITDLRQTPTEKYHHMRRRARQAALSYSWDAYTDRLKLLLENH